MLLNPGSKIASQTKWSPLFKSKSYRPLFEHREMERQTSVIKSHLAKKKKKQEPLQTNNL